jgi:transposase-like protein
MPERRRKYTTEFKTEAARMVVETSRPIAEVAREIHVHEGTLSDCNACSPQSPTTTVIPSPCP